MNSGNRYEKILAHRLFDISVVRLKGIDLLLEVAGTKTARII